MDTAEATKILNKALIAEGFVDGKYGEVPYKILYPSPWFVGTGEPIANVSKSGDNIVLVANERRIAWFEIFPDGRVIKHLRVAQWLAGGEMMGFMGWMSLGSQLPNRSIKTEVSKTLQDHINAFVKDAIARAFQCKP
jgi:hypothetical protein